MLLQPASEWCQCGKCQNMPTFTECICCINHHLVADKLTDRGQQFKCITDHPGVLEMMAPAPLESAWNSYLHFHRKFS